LETIEGQVRFSMDVWNFFLAFLSQHYNRWKFWCLLVFMSKSTNREGFGLYRHFCPSFPMMKVLIYISIFVQDYQRWNFWSLWPRLHLLATLIMNTNGKSYVTGSLSLSSIWHPDPPHTSSHSLEAILAFCWENRSSCSRRQFLTWD